MPLVKDTYGSERRKAKTLNFSIAYGKTVHGLAQVNINFYVNVWCVFWMVSCESRTGDVWEQQWLRCQEAFLLIVFLHPNIQPLVCTALTIPPHLHEQDWGITKEAAQETLDAWYRDRPEVKAWQEKTMYAARKQGWVNTIMGR